MNRYSIKYEFLNTLNNGYAFFFGALFPILLLHLIVNGSMGDIPEQYISEAVTGVFIGLAMFVPLASVFLSHAATYANEIEKKIPERIKLFGFSEGKILGNKMISSFIFLTFCLLIYFAGTIPFSDIIKPTAKSAIIWIFGIYLLSAELIALAHAITTFFGKFGPTYGVTMALYFVMMILSGYMGLPISKLPKFLKPVSDILPTTQLGNSYINLWMGRDYSFTPLIKSFLIFGAFCVAFLFLSFKLRARKKTA